MFGGQPAKMTAAEVVNIAKQIADMKGYSADPTTTSQYANGLSLMIQLPSSVHGQSWGTVPLSLSHRCVATLAKLDPAQELPPCQLLAQPQEALDKWFEDQKAKNDAVIARREAQETAAQLHKERLLASREAPLASGQCRVKESKPQQWSSASVNVTPVIIGVGASAVVIPGTDRIDVSNRLPWASSDHCGEPAERLSTLQKDHWQENGCATMAMWDCSSGRREPSVVSRPAESPIGLSVTAANEQFVFGVGANGSSGCGTGADITVLKFADRVESTWSHSPSSTTEPWFKSCLVAPSQWTFYCMDAPVEHPESVVVLYENGGKIWDLDSSTVTVSFNSKECSAVGWRGGSSNSIYAGHYGGIKVFDPRTGKGAGKMRTICQVLDIHVDDNSVIATCEGGVNIFDVRTNKSREEIYIDRAWVGAYNGTYAAVSHQTGTGLTVFECASSSTWKEIATVEPCLLIAGTDGGAFNDILSPGAFGFGNHFLYTTTHGGEVVSMYTFTQPTTDADLVDADAGNLVDFSLATARARYGVPNYASAALRKHLVDKACKAATKGHAPTLVPILDEAKAAGVMDVDRMALSVAIENGREKLVRALVNDRAVDASGLLPSPYGGGDEFEPAIATACRMGKWEIASWLLENGHVDCSKEAFELTVQPMTKDRFAAKEAAVSAGGAFDLGTSSYFGPISLAAAIDGPSSAPYISNGDNEHAVELLLQHKANPNVAWGNGVTPLLASVGVLMGKSAKITSLLLDAGADVDVVDPQNGRSPLETITTFGCHQDLEANASPADAAAGTGAGTGAGGDGGCVSWMTVVRKLLDRKCAVTAKCMHDAATSVLPALMNTLLANGGDANAVLDVAAQQPPNSSGRMAGPSPSGADEQNITAIRHMRTPLMSAASSETALALVSAGAEVNWTDVATGRSVLHAALLVQNPVPDVISLLLSRGADAKAVDSQGNTVFHLCGSKMHYALTSVYDKLVASGADPMAVNKAGHTPMYYGNRVSNRFFVEWMNGRSGS